MHTPTPWKIRELGEDCFVEGNSIAGSTIAGEYHREILSDEDYPEKKDDAQFIVKAVNSHNELLEALKKIEEHASRASLVQDRSVHIIKQTCSFIAKQARAAIKKAEA